MKRILQFLLLPAYLCVGTVYGQQNVASNISPAGSNTNEKSQHVKWMAGTESMPGHLKAFQENRGQFLNLMNNWKVLYGTDYEGAKILFTDHGVIYTLSHTVDDNSPAANEKDQENAVERGKEKQARKKIVYDNFAIEWENTNPLMTVEAVGQTPYTFGAILSTKESGHFDNVKGYTRLVFHNVYPNIDIEYSFHSDQGLEYSFIIHPGANPANIKLFYHDVSGVRLNANGDIHLPTPEGDIIDHAPLTYQGGQKVESSFRKINDNEVVFNTADFDASKDLVIDPWTVNPIGVGFLPNDVHFDGAGNVYIYGSALGQDNYVQKYTAGGALSWTYDLTQYGSFSGYISDLAVDNTGNSYVAGPYPYLNGAGGYYSMVSLTTGGALRYFNNSNPTATPTMFEVWNLAYSCGYSELIEAGSPTIEQEQVAVVNSANGNLGGETINATYGEIYAGCIGPNGNYYCIAANPCFSPCGTPGDEIVCYTVAAGTATFSWGVQSTYQWDDFDSKNPDGIATNGIAAGCSYLYTSDGASIDQRSLTTGASLKQVALPGGAATNPSPSGIAVDMGCGYVYAGTPTSVEEYDMNLNPITSQATPYETYGVAFANGEVAACGGAASTGEFVMVFTGQACSTALTITHVNGTCTTPSSATVATPTFCAGPYSYLWSPGGQTTQTITGIPSGIYTVTVGTASSCSTVTDTVTIISSSPVNVTAATTSGVCSSSAKATVTGGTAPFTYSWSNGVTIDSITSVPSGTYTITVTDKNGCIGQAVVTLTAVSGPAVTTTSSNVICYGGKSGSGGITVTGGTAPYKYTWSSGQSTSNINGVAAGSYTCTVTDASGCSDMVTINITQPPQLRDSIISVTNPKCNGDKNGSIITGAKGGANPLTFSWSNGTTNVSDTGLPAGSYTLTITDSNGCVSKINSTLTQPTAVTVVTGNDTICGGNNATLTSTANGGNGPYTYMWNGTFPTQNITVTPATSTTYTIIATDSHGCTSLPANATVVVEPAPNVAFIPDTTNGCYPQCIKFTDLTTLVGGAGVLKSWAWTFGDGSTDTLQNPTYCYNKPGIYSVSLTVVTNSGCKAKLNVPNLITIYDHPHANFVGNPQPANIMQPFIQFTDQTTDLYGLQSWFWTFGDATDSTSTIQNPGHTYTDTGTFCPTLVVTNIHQCTDSIEHCIVIDPLFTLYIPNAFTPNNDTRDEEFTAKGIYVCTFEMWIFDRWGQEIYHTNDINQGWNGHVGNSSNMCQEDTYVYKIDATDCERHNKHEYVGRVSLIR